MQSILILGLIFFAVMILYNLKKAVTENGSYLGATFGLLMFISTLLILLGHTLVGSFGFIIILLLSLFYSKTISEIRMKQFMKGMEGVEYISSPALRDIFNLKFWGVYAMKIGARKAAIGCSLFQTSFVIFMLGVMDRFLKSPMEMTFLVPFAIVMFLAGWREYESVFRKYSEQQLMDSVNDKEQ
ncbi:hypothetical protein [Methanococcoides sp. FTZ1]|uniref:hypothetical protein n=1 Tax=Methanococcoides sp. FTZ1 TaxID=3439061 RepID=UPI003F866AD2